VVDPVLSVIAESTYGPQLPLTALVTQAAPEVLGGGLADVVLGLGDGLVVLGLGETGLGETGLGDAGLGDCELGDAAADVDWDEDGEVVVMLGLGVGLGECRWLGLAVDGRLPDATLPMTGSQPATATRVAATAIAGQIRIVFTSRLLYLSGHHRRALTGAISREREISPRPVPVVDQGGSDDGGRGGQPG
jgi:hypothetical protein